LSLPRCARGRVANDRRTGIVPSTRYSPLTILRSAMVLGLGMAMLLGGCGTGQQTQTSSQQSAVDGAQGQIGPIAVRNVQLAYPDGRHYYWRGSDVPLLLTIVNTGTTEDELTSVTSPVARSVRVEGQRTLPAQRTLRAVAPSDVASSSWATQTGLDQGQIRIVLEDLTEDVRPGMTVRVTLLFRHAGEITLDVPVSNPDEPRAESNH
jgi:periplasmic copper chaperone A